MAKRREPVQLAFDTTEFDKQMGRLRATMAQLDVLATRQRLHAATWEPHDWSEFD